MRNDIRSELIAMDLPWFRSLQAEEVEQEVQPCNTPFTTTATFKQELAKECNPTTREVLDARAGALGLAKNLAKVECSLTEKCKQVKFRKIVNVEYVDWKRTGTQDDGRMGVCGDGLG